MTRCLSANAAVKNKADETEITTEKSRFLPFYAGRMRLLVFLYNTAVKLSVSLIN